MRKFEVVSSDRVTDDSAPASLELPVEELLRRARPLPPREEMIIDDLTAEEGEAFLAAVREARGR